MNETYKLQFTEPELIVVSVVFSVNAVLQLLFKILVFRLVYKRGPLSQVWPHIFDNNYLQPQAHVEFFSRFLFKV